MSLLYFLFNLALTIWINLTYWRTTSLNKKNRAHKDLVNMCSLKVKHSHREDEYTRTKNQLELNKLVTKQEKLDKKFFFWDKRYDAAEKTRDMLRRWRGRKLPYMLGIADLVGLLTLLQYLGLIHIDTSMLKEQILLLIDEEAINVPK